MADLEGLQINPQEIHGNWRAGYALDYHTVSSRLLPDGTYDTERTEIGELVFEVKYRANRNKIQPIGEIAAKFVKEEFSVNGYPILPYLDLIIPVPPSDTNRTFQPVTEIAEEIGQILDISVISDYLIKVKEIMPVKNLEVEENRNSSVVHLKFNLHPQNIAVFWCLTISTDLGKLYRKSPIHSARRAIYPVCLS